MLAADQITGADEYSGLKHYHGTERASIWKARVIAVGLGGKRSGYRYIFERIELDGELCAVGLAIHLHQDDTKEYKLREKIKERSRLLEDSNWKRHVEL